MPRGGVSFRMNTKQWEKKFRNLKRSQIEPFIAGALNATAFSVMKAERTDVLASGFKFNANTANFLSSHKVIRAGTYNVDMGAYVLPRGSTLNRMSKSESILRDHQQPKTIRHEAPDDAARLGLGTPLAIPAEVERGGQGRVPAKFKPTRLAARGLKGKGRGRKHKAQKGAFPFLPLGGGKVGLFFREKGKGIRLGFVLQKQAQLKTGPLNFFGVAKAVALTEFPRKMTRAFDRVRGFQ